jgi:cysteine-rich repeat protein
MGCQDPAVESFGVLHSPENDQEVGLPAADAGSKLTDASSTAAAPTGNAAWHVTCGDGVVDRGESCDDANHNNGDCCQTESPWCGPDGWYRMPGPCHCGDGILDGTERCDDGNLESADGCSASCEAETGKCGDKATDQDEQCDDGNLERFDGCDENCRNESSCRNK